jgi:hypothetical protein
MSYSEGERRIANDEFIEAAYSSSEPTSTPATAAMAI